MNTKIKIIMIILIGIFFSACSVRFPQIEALLVNKAEQKDPLDDFKYLISIENETIEVLAIAFGEMTAYANDKDQAIFVEDGQIIRAMGISQLEPISASTKMFIALGPAKDIKENQPWKALCDPSIQTEGGSMIKYCQLSDHRFTSHFEVNTQGSIVRLTQVVDNTGRIISIKKKN